MDKRTRNGNAVANGSGVNGVHKNATQSSSQLPLQAALLVAVLALAMNATGFNEPFLYLSPPATAVFVYAFMPRSIKRWMLGTLAVSSLVAFVFHAHHPKGGIPRGSHEGQVALVTGASAGIGREIAKEMAARGYGLILVARRREKLLELEQEISASASVPITIIPADLVNPNAAEYIHQQINHLKLTVNMLVNNAGISYAEDFIDLPEAKVEELINLNVLSLTKLTRLLVPPMVKRGQGRVMMVSSIAGAAPGPYVAVYSATKAYVSSLAVALQHELEPKGVTVTNVVPGATFTEFSKVAHAEKAFCFWFPYMAMQAREVAVAAVEGCLQGLTTVVPGPVNVMYLTAASILPPKLLRWVTEFAWK